MADWRTTKRCNEKIDRSDKTQIEIGRPYNLLQCNISRFKHGEPFGDVVKERVVRMAAETLGLSEAEPVVSTRVAPEDEEIVGEFSPRFSWVFDRDRGVAARHLFNWSIENGLTTHTPFRVNGVAVIKVRPSPGRTRRLQDGEAERLLAAADPFTKDRIVAILDTGLRGGTLLRLQWRDVQGDRIVVPPEKLKRGKRALVIPVKSKRLREVLDRRRLGPDGEELGPEAFVFGTNTGEPMPRRRAHELWAATRTAAKVDGLNFHDLRGEHASELLESGAPLHMVRDARPQQRDDDRHVSQVADVRPRRCLRAAGGGARGQGRVDQGRAATGRLGFSLTRYSRLDLTEITMPYITFAWYSRKAADRAIGIAHELKDLADAHNVAFHVTAKSEEEEGTEPVAIEGVRLPPAIVEQLRGLAMRFGVTIHVQSGEGLGRG